MKKALVTGGTRGIGQAIAQKLGQMDIDVTITGRKNTDSSFSFMEVDFLDPKSFNQFLFDLETKEFDILINNAGINKINPVGEIQIEDWNNILMANLTAPFQIIQACLPSMLKKEYGRILNISSIFGHVSKEKRAAYSASKFGLLGLTKACAADYAQNNILVNCLGPGFIDTELTRTILTNDQIQELTSSVPMKRLGAPEEIAESASFLTSEQNTFITGQLIIADGGFTCV
ncbi:MAG: SDR family oxidoreductase [Halobacteriovoraceae bacterium]|nr:SDR family oxidoreductase [Halobacteriovoraceae bacterium]